MIFLSEIHFWIRNKRLPFSLQTGNLEKMAAIRISVFREKSYCSWFKLLMSLPLLSLTLIGPTFHELAPSIVFDRDVQSIIEKTITAMIGEKLLIALYSPPQLLIANFPIICNSLTKALQRENIDFLSILSL